MPEVRNCKRCKKIFMYTPGGAVVCDACRKLEDEEYEKVRKFLRDFPGATIQEVSNETEVNMQLIYRFLREGRIEVADDSPIALQCETCGSRITSGRFCMNCSKKLANDMINAGRSLNTGVSQRNEKAEGSDSGLRYMHEYKREK